MTLKSQQKLLLDSVLLGVVGALGAQAFMFLLRWSQKIFLGWIAGFKGLGADASITAAKAGPHGMWLLPLATTLGGLVTGVLVYSLAPEAEGHGTDAVVNAFHNLAGNIRARVPFIKMLASAITIGSGGSAGREGPVALISAGFGSVYARRFRRTEREARLLILIGMAAGLSAIFRSPIGTAIFSVEVLYSEMDFEAGALVYALLAAIIAYALNGVFVGFQPLFEIPAQLMVPSAADYAWYIVLGVVCGGVATILPMALYGIRDLFRMIPCRPHYKPAIAGLAVGLVGLAFPQLLGGGYGWIQAAIDGHLSSQLLLILCFGKILTFALTIGSGGSGGVFAPSLYTGAMLGGFLGHLCHQPSAAFAMVGMAAVFGAAARVPLATILMATAMTGGYHFLAAAALAVVLSSTVQAALSARLKYKTLYEAQVPSRAYSPSHYVEQLRTALDLLRSPRLSARVQERGLELMSLLASGVPLNLVEGKQIRIGVLRAKSSLVGQPISLGWLTAVKGDVDCIVVLREHRLLGPHGDLKLEAGDQLVVLASEQDWSALSEHLDDVARAQKTTRASPGGTRLNSVVNQSPVDKGQET